MSSVRPSASLSVCLSVTLVDQDHTGRKTWKLIAWTITAQHLRCSQPNCHPPTPKGTWGNFEETRGGVGKSIIIVTEIFVIFSVTVAVTVYFNCHILRKTDRAYSELT